MKILCSDPVTHQPLVVRASDAQDTLVANSNVATRHRPAAPRKRLRSTSPRRTHGEPRQRQAAVHTNSVGPGVRDERDIRRAARDRIGRPIRWNRPCTAVGIGPNDHRSSALPGEQRAQPQDNRHLHATAKPYPDPAAGRFWF